MAYASLTLRQVRDRLALLNCYLVLSPPAPDGLMYFMGNKQGYFPFRNGPVCYVKARELDAILPGKQIVNILNRLEMTEQEFNQFWHIVDHREVTETRNRRQQ